MNEAIKIVKAGPKPLALYIFSANNNVVEQILEETSSGGVTVNDCLMHVCSLLHFLHCSTSSLIRIELLDNELTFYHVE